MSLPDNLAVAALDEMHFVQVKKSISEETHKILPWFKIWIVAKLLSLRQPNY